MASVTIRIDDTLKKQASQVTESFGVNLTDSLKMFVKYVARTRTIPIDTTKRIANSNEKKIDYSHIPVVKPDPMTGYTNFGKYEPEDDVYEKLFYA